MDINEILSEVCGINDEGDPKTLVSMSVCKINVADPENDIEEVDNQGTEEAIVQIYPLIDELVQIDLIFPSSDNVTMFSMWNAMEKYTEDTAEFAKNGGEGKCPSLVFYFVPLDDDDNDSHYYLSASLPLIHTLTSMKVNQYPTCIRMIFHTDSISLLEMDDGFHFDEINEEIEAEMKRRDELEQMEEEKRAKKELEAERLKDLSQKYLS